MQTGGSIFLHWARANRSPGLPLGPDHVMLMLPRFSRDQLASKARGDWYVPIVLKLSDGIHAAACLLIAMWLIGYVARRPSSGKSSVAKIWIEEMPGWESDIIFFWSLLSFLRLASDVALIAANGTEEQPFRCNKTVDLTLKAETKSAYDGKSQIQSTN